MTTPEVGAARTQLVEQRRFSARTTGGPCAPARGDVDARCADAERLTAAAQAHQQTLREALLEHDEAVRMLDGDVVALDRRQIAEQKTKAQADYHAAVVRAADQASVHDAAAAWLRRIDQLNRHARTADARVDQVAQRVAELERALPGLELAADAARITAEAAQAGCLQARRTLAACEEQAQRNMTRGVPTAVASGGSRVGGVAAAPDGSAAPTARAPWSSNGSMSRAVAPRPPAEQPADVARAARVLVRGDRQVLLGVALRLADETGFDAGRMQLLLLELRDQIIDRSLEDHALGFPVDHPFWSQFSPDGARHIVASLASMGYRFDGRDGWIDGHVPQVRDFGLALTYCGYDPRTLRRPAGQAALDALWQGTTVRSEEYLLARAPDLSLTHVVAFLGSRSGRLAELWDMWGRLRPLLVRAGQSAT